MGEAVDLSVVIPFRNAAEHLGGMLGSLAAQRFERRWEVVLADNGSTDDWRRAVMEFADRLNLRVVDAGAKKGSAFARNLGARNASGSKLVFVDADDEVAPGYVAAMAQALDRHEFVTSAFDHVTLNPEWVRLAHGPVWRDPDDPLFVQFGVLPFAGGSIGVSRSVFEAVGGFPEEFTRMQDIALSWEIQFQGVDLHYVPEAVYRVRYRSTLYGLFRQGLAGGSHAPLLYRRYRRAGMSRRTASDVVRSWIRLGRALARARSKADLAPLSLELGRQLGRPLGSVRQRIYFP